MASASYERRNDRARSLGYESYYDYRAHGNGAIPPDRPRLSGDALRGARGHAATSDLVRQIEGGRVEILNVVKTGPDSYRANVTLSNGKTVTYNVKGAGVDKVSAAITSIGAGGGGVPFIVTSPEAEDFIDDATAAEEAAAEEAALQAEAMDELSGLEDYDPDEGIPF